MCYPWTVCGGSGRTVGSFETRADADAYALLHPSYTVAATCVECGGNIAPVLVRFGSTKCHDCR